MMNPHPKLQFSIPSTQSGFTLIESLMAIIVVAVLMAAIAPVLVLSTANRVQAKRVERATSAAKSYTDGVRSGVYKAPPITNSTNVPAPTARGNLVCSANAYCTIPFTPATYQLFCVDGDGDGKCKEDSPKDMVVQAFGYQQNPTGATNDDRADQGYGLKIRVYRADAFKENATLQKSSSGVGFGSSSTATRAQARTYTGGLGNSLAPQVELATEIVTTSTKYEDLCARTNGCTTSSPTP